MGAERKHRDRAVRFQGDWSGAGATVMPDHYTKSKMAITLGMVSALVRDLKSGWRPGPKAEPDLIAYDLPDAPALHDAPDDPETDALDEDRDSDASDLGEIAGPTIDFYIQDLKPSDRMVTPEAKLHVRSLDNPDRPACTRLANKISISQMICVGRFPTAASEICYWCRRKRPEVLDQLDGHTVEDEP